MASFVAHGPSWSVEDLSGERYPVFVLWNGTGMRVLGAAGEGSVEELVVSQFTSEANLAGKTGKAGKQDALTTYSLRFLLGRIGPTPRGPARLSTLDVTARNGPDGWVITGIRERRAVVKSASKPPARQKKRRGRR